MTGDVPNLIQLAKASQDSTMLMARVMFSRSAPSEIGVEEPAGR
ncbi:hypothetical protein ABZ260_44365 [Streptosporangium sp. NPDC006013]